MKNKVAIVTGGGSGNGRATSLIYAREGAKVVIGDVNVEGGNAAVEEIWMGLTTVERELHKLKFSGAREIARSMQMWLGLSPFARVKKAV